MSPRRLTPEEAAALLAPRDTLGVPLGPGQPPALLRALGERDDWDELTVSCGLLMGMYPLFAKKGVRLLSGFFGPVERGLAGAGHDVQFVPADFRRFTRALEMRPPRVMATAAATPDADGHLSFSLHAGATTGAIAEAARDPDRLLVVEVNPKLPRTLGLPPDAPHGIHVDEVDVLVEAETPLVALPDPPPTDADRAIAEHARGFIHDGSTLQTGIGGIPSQVVSLLADGPGGDYGVHSEMFTSGLMKLHQAGKVSNRKGLFDGVSVCTFAAGTQELYDWLDGGDAVRFLPVEQVNSPEAMMRNRDLVCINGALAVDLAGQVAADTRGPGQYSGIGGHEDFAAGPGLDSRDRSLICLPATFEAGGQRRSRIVATFAPGTLVTTPRHQVDVVITEFGVAELAGMSVGERVEALIAIAHPDDRVALRAAWEAGQGAA